MTVRRHYVINTDGDPFDEFEAAVEQLEEEQGITFEFDEADSPDGAITKYVFYESNGRARLILGDDPDTPARYFIVEARDASLADRIAGALTNALPVWSTADLREMAERDLAEDPGSMVRMALGASSEADSATLDILNRGLRHDDREVRLSAIEALSLTQWQEAADLLASARDNDPDPELQEYAGRALDMLHQALG